MKATTISTNADFTITALDAGHDDLRGYLVVTLHRRLPAAALRRLDECLDVPESVDSGTRRYRVPCRRPRAARIALATALLEQLTDRRDAIWEPTEGGWKVVEYLRPSDDPAAVLAAWHELDDVYVHAGPGELPN